MKTALITGASSGIGLASAHALSRSGFRVGLLARRIEPLNAAVAAIREAGGEAWACAADVRDAAGVGAFVHQAVDRYGRIDLLVHSAGVFQLRSFEQMSPALWEETLGVNLTGAFIVSQAVWPHIAGGQIIHISSVAGVQPFPGCAAYSASKYGLVGLSEVLALEGKARNIRVHVVCPGNTETPLWQGQAPAEVQARMMRPEQVAEVVRWLAVSPPVLTFDRVVVRPARDPWEAGDA